MTLKVENLFKKFGQKIVFDDLSFDFPDSNTISLIGENGIGKSTFINCLINVEKLDSGSVFWENEKVRLNSLNWKKQIGFISNSVQLIEFYSLLENLKIKKIFYDIDKVNFEERCAYFSQLFFDSAEFIFENRQEISSFSTGMKKKSMIIASLIHNPKLNFWDEPFSGLDEITKDKVVELINHRAFEGGFFLVCDHEKEQLSKISLNKLEMSFSRIKNCA
jgi:ABC-2 type transport system ATP-binding protein